MDYAVEGLRYNRIMEPAYWTALAPLGPPRGSRGLDAGCGPGGLVHLLIEATGGRGYIVGVDGSAPHLAAVRNEVARHGLGDRVRIEAADLRERLPFAD